MTAIIVAAGSGRRMGFDKLTANLAGEPVLARTVRAFDACSDVDHIVLVTAADRYHLVAESGISTHMTQVDGGTERHDSVANGLASIDDTEDFIAVHDGARPLISPDSISACLAAAREHGAATCARRVTETMKRGDANDFVDQAVDRDALWAMETPQIFAANLLRTSYDHVTRQGQLVTDEVSALALIGVKTKLVAHGRPNPKITFPEDLAYAAQLLK